MTDLIGRIAARAVGARTREHPLQAGVEVGAGLEIVDEEVVVSREATPPFAEPQAPSGRAVPAGRRAERRTAASPPALRARVPEAAKRVDAAPRRTASQPPLSERPRPVRETPPAVPAARVPVVAPAGESQAVPAASVAVPAAPAAVRAAPVPAPVPASAVSAREEPPPVRIHIGRLEVRANLREAPRPAPPAPREPDGLSLGDYLRGRREP